MKTIGSYPEVRLRRNRKTDWSRRLVSENSLSSNDLIWPIFLTEGKNKKEQISKISEDSKKTSSIKRSSVTAFSLKPFFFRVPMDLLDNL